MGLGIGGELFYCRNLNRDSHHNLKAWVINNLVPQAVFKMRDPGNEVGPETGSKFKRFKLRLCE